MACSSVRLTVLWKVPQGQTRAITAALQTVMLATRHEHGCLACSLSTDVGRQVTLRYREDWDSEESLKRQVRSDRFVALATLIEAATEPPQIEFALPTGSRGLDYAEEVREVRRPADA